ncbi:AMP-dependent synthetase/ligase [Thermodesulfobacteriota bacterium]
MGEVDRVEAKTIPELFLNRVKKDPSRIAFIHVDKGAWTPVTYQEYYDQARIIGYGFASVGLKKGDAVSIWANNCSEWFYADIGITLMGGMPIGVYQTDTAEQGAYVIEHSNSKTLIVEGQEEVDKILTVWDDLPMLEHVFAINHVETDDTRIRPFQEIYELGRKLEQEQPNLLEDRARSVQPEDMVTLVYTSGTTGPPKGVMLSHHCCLYFLDQYSLDLPVGKDDVTVGFLPLCHVGGRMGAHYVNIFSGMTPVFAESWEELLFNLGEVRPTFIGTTPRLIEKFHSMIQTYIDDAPKLQQLAAGWATKVGYEMSEVLQDKHPVSPWLKIKFKIADVILFRKVRDIFGGKMKYFMSGGAPIARQLIEYFHGVGILILEGFGQSETSGNVCQNKAEDYRFGSVGKAYLNSEIKLADDGEIYYRGEGSCIGYYNDTEATKALIDDKNWLCTGDVGVFDDDGYLYITDRKKDIMITSGGKNVTPQNIENLLKTSKYISHACVFGDARKYLTALLTLDEDEALKFARDNKIIFKDLRDLTKRPEILKLIGEVVKEKNSELHRVEQIKKFSILEEELDPDEGEITPTMKVKRRILYERYEDIVEGMYASKR